MSKDESLERPWPWIAYGPIRAMMGKGGATYRGYVEAALARSDEDFRELYGRARLAGLRGFDLRVDYFRGMKEQVS